MKKKEKIFIWLIIAISTFWCIVHWQPYLLPPEESSNETINYGNREEQPTQPGWGPQSDNSNNEIVVPYKPEESNSPEAQELKKQQQQQQQQQEKQEENKCNWIKLNTNFPIIWNCITISEWKVNPTNVFPWMMRALTRIIMSMILVVCFIMIIIAWIMWAWAWEDSSQKTKAKDIIKKVAITVLLLWFSWAILRLINPNFFG